MRDVVISLCDETGNMVRPWAESGFECWCVDIEHSIRRDKVEKVGAGFIHYVWGDVRSWTPPENIVPRIAALFAFPPCTDVSLSGARDFQKKGGWALASALEIFDSCMMAAVYSGAPFMLENPKSRFSTHRRKPDHKFQPWEYGDLYYKETWLWTGGGFVMPPKIHATPPHGTTDMIFKMPPSEDRAAKRSITPVNFARAVYESNHNPNKIKLDLAI